MRQCHIGKSFSQSTKITSVYIHQKFLLILGSKNILVLTEGLFGNMYLCYYILGYILLYPSKNLRKIKAHVWGWKKINKKILVSNFMDYRSEGLKSKVYMLVFFPFGFVFLLILLVLLL